MSRPVGLSGMCYCYFSEFHVDGKRRLSIKRVVWLATVPLIAGILIYWRVGVPNYASLQIYLPLIAVLAAVLIGLLPLIHSIIGQVDATQRYKVGEVAVAHDELDRIRVLQDLHAAISWAVILLVAALVLVTAVILTPDYLASPANLPTSRPTSTLIGVVQAVLSVLIYAIAASTGTSFFDISSGIFEAMESYSENLKSRIKNNIELKDD